jgi:hypothetical protein
MKKVLLFAATAICFASCSNEQEKADMANQATIDSMSREITKQHIIDSMNAAYTGNGATGETDERDVQSNGSTTVARSPSIGQAANYSSTTPEGAAPRVAGGSGANNKATGPTPAEIEAKRKADNRKKAKSAATGAVIGAGAGAIGGAISGKNDHFKRENAAIGAGFGAAVGAGAGLLLQKRKLKKEQDSTSK